MKRQTIGQTPFIIREEMPAQVNLQNRWGSLLVIIMTVAGLLAAFLLRDTILSASIFFENLEAGLALRYPASWIVETEGDFVLRVTDPESLPFKTTITASVRIIGLETSAVSVVNRITLERSPSLPGYDVLESREIQTPYGIAESVSFTYIAIENNPLLQSIPVPMRGQDIIFIKERQAIILTYTAARENFDPDYFYFENMLRSLVF